jgi:hypothetical protein
MQPFDISSSYAWQGRFERAAQASRSAGMALVGLLPVASRIALGPVRAGAARFVVGPPCGWQECISQLPIFFRVRHLLLWEKASKKRTVFICCAGLRMFSFHARAALVHLPQGVGAARACLLDNALLPFLFLL